MKNDQHLQADVLAELKWDPRVRGNEIGVIAKDGAVTLTGLVDSYAAKVAAENAAKRVKGVRAIAEEIQVQPPAQLRKSDEGIAERIARILGWSAVLRGTDILAEVSAGFVTLTGKVDDPHQMREAVSRVEDLEGVTGIASYIEVRERTRPIDAREVVREITRALHRHASIEASNVHVAIADGKVTLSGTVETYPERELVERAAWTVHGVKQVEDRLEIGGG